MKLSSLAVSVNNELMSFDSVVWSSSINATRIGEFSSGTTRPAARPTNNPINTIGNRKRRRRVARFFFSCFKYSFVKKIVLRIDCKQPTSNHQKFSSSLWRSPIRSVTHFSNSSANSFSRSSISSLLILPTSTRVLESSGISTFFTIFPSCFTRR